MPDTTPPDPADATPPDPSPGPPPSAPGPVRPRRPLGRRVLRVGLWGLAGLVGLPVLLVALVLAAGNTAPGRRLIERETASLTGGTVLLRGLAGRFPDRLRLAHAEVRDADGAWIALDDLALDWSPLRLLSREAAVDRLSVTRLSVPRLPVPGPARPEPAKQPEGGGFRLPVRVDVRALDVERLELGAPVAGVAAALRLTGSARVESLEQGSADVTVARLDSPGTYRVSGHVDPAAIVAHLSAQEPAHGLISAVARLPDLGAISLEAAVDGPRTAEATTLALRAGALHADATGTVDIPGRAARLDLAAGAPAMTPAPGVSWQSVALVAHVQGPFTTPDATAHLQVVGVSAGGAALQDLSADVAGNRGEVGLTAALAGLRIPGPKPELLAGAPMRLVAHVTLSQPARPVTFTLSHPLLAATGHADTAQVGTGAAITGHVDLTLPELGPLAAAGGVVLDGHAALGADIARTGSATTADVAGTVALTGGQAQAVALLGSQGRIALGVTQDGADITLRSLLVDGQAVHLTGSGTDRGGVLDLAASLVLPQLAAVAPAVSGEVTVDAHVAGPTTNLAADATAKGTLATAGLPRGPLTLAVHATGLPGAPDGTVTAEGRFDGSPVSLAAAVRKTPDGALHVTLGKADWKSAHAVADLSLPPGATLPVGSLDLRMTRLADLQPVIHQPVAGSVTATVATASVGDHPQARLDVRATDAGLPGEHVGRLALTGTVEDPVAHPVVALRLVAEGIDAAGVGGSAQVQADGPEDALAIRLGTALSVGGQPATAQATATLDLSAKAVQLRSLAAAFHGEDLRLLAPARITFAPTVGVDRLRLGLQQAVLELAGQVSPTLDLTASLRGVTPDLARPFVPSLDADGRLSADARLTGTPAAPQGTVRLAAESVRMRTGPGRSLPPASLLATALLQGHAARVDARLAAGRQVSLTLAGQAPLGQGPLDLRANGLLDLAVTDPVLTAGGRRVRGTLALDATVTGTTAQPRIGGTARLAGGEVQDYAQGAHVTDIAALIVAAGDTVRIQSFSGHAGPGTVAVAGSVGVFAPGLPVDLRITAQNARPLASDLLTATIDAALTVRGQARTRLDAAGTVTIERADITVPSALPPSIATLNVIRPGQKPPAAAAAPALVLGLDVTASTKGPIFVRGHGLDAELGGRLHVGGTSAAPQVSGGFDMRRGTFSLAGTNLTFTRGRVGFDGTGVTDRIDPTLDFEADSTAGSTTATLKVTGYADAPKIALSSSPPLPQDEVLAQILFGQSIKQLSPFQIAEIASALAELSGVGGGDDMLAAVRKRLGLDRLSVGGTTSGNGASLEAGKYVAQGVYVGAKEGTDGGTQAQVQVDLTKHLKLESQLGAGGGVPATGITPQNDPGSSVGLKYQFEY